jgi:hypothetical protein
MFQPNSNALINNNAAQKTAHSEEDAHNQEKAAFLAEVPLALESDLHRGFYLKCAEYSLA